MLEDVAGHELQLLLTPAAGVRLSHTALNVPGSRPVSVMGGSDAG